MSFFFACPGCGKEIKAEEEWIGQAAECPFCLATVVISEPTSATKTEKIKKVENRINVNNRDICKIAQHQSFTPLKIEYTTAVIEIDEPNQMAKKLNSYAMNGWIVVSQSTIFLSEGSVGLYGFGAGTKREGILYTFKREKKVE